MRTRAAHHGRDGVPLNGRGNRMPCWLGSVPDDGTSTTSIPRASRRAQPVSPTDVIPVTASATLTMALRSLISLAVIGADAVGAGGWRGSPDVRPASGPYHAVGRWPVRTSTAMGRGV